MSNNCRIMGNCTVECVKNSYVHRILSAASHPVIFGFQHWLVYFDVMCLYHNRVERWIAEKINHQISDIQGNSQCIRNGNIFISCSRYYKHTEFDKTKDLYYAYNLQDIFGKILQMENNGYSIFIDDCKIFKEKLWNNLNEALF